MIELGFEWEIDPDVDSSDHREGPVYDLWMCTAFSYDIECDGCGGCAPLGSLGACDFGPDCNDPTDGWNREYRQEMEQQLAGLLAAGPLVPTCGHAVNDSEGVAK